MPAYIIVHMTPKNADALAEYSRAALPTIEKRNGRFLTKGPSEPLHGNNNYKAGAVIEFPSLEVAQEWYDSEEYQALIPARNEAMESEFNLIQA